MNFPARKIFFTLNKKERRKFLLLSIADVIISFTDIFSLAVLVYVINTLAQPIPARSFDDIIKNNSLLITGLLCILFCAKNWLAQIIFTQQQYHGYQVAARISNDKLLNYLEGDFKNYTETHSSVHIRSISQQPIEFIHYMLRNLQQIFNQLILILFSVATILLYNTTLFLLLFVILTPLLVITGAIIRKKNQQLRQNAKKASELSLQHLQESLDAYIESNIFNKKGFFRSRYAKSQFQFNNTLAEQQTVQNFPARFSEAFGIIGFFVLLVINEKILKTQISFITIGAFVMAAYKIVPAIVKIFNSLAQLNAYHFTLNEMPQPAEIANNAPSSFPALIKLEVKGLAFNYNNRNVFSDLNFFLQRGELVGLSGISGKGKTTLINILLGFIVPDRGSVYINDEAATSEQIKHYREKISYVRQQSLVINDSISRNISLNESDITETKLQEAIAHAGIETIAKTKDHSNYIIKENGRNISGGQKQRIAFARGLYKEYDLLILDEPFNELDAEAELLMLRQLKLIAHKGKMVLLITHNSDALALCDKVVLL